MYSPTPAPTSPQRRTAVILAHGDFPRRADLLALLREAEWLICCDGAANDCLAQGIIPHAIVGDCDSLSDEIKRRFADRIHRIAEQESNDLSKAFHHALALGARHFTLLGATGKREDHFVANMALLMDYADELRAHAAQSSTPTDYSLRMLSDYGSFYPCLDHCQLRGQVGQELSIFNFGATQLQAEGLMYPLYDIDRLWQGTLNQLTQPAVSIRARGKFLVYLAEFD